MINSTNFSTQTLIWIYNFKLIIALAFTELNVFKKTHAKTKNLSDSLEFIARI